MVIGETIPKVVERGLAEFCDVFCDSGYFTVEESRAMLLAAKEAGLTVARKALEVLDGVGAGAGFAGPDFLRYYLAAAAEQCGRYRQAAALLAQHEQLGAPALGPEAEILAIELALASAREGDCVLLAGKGHEDYQILGTVKRHFDDREEVRRVLGARG